MNAQSPIDGRPISGPDYPSWTDRVKVPESQFNTDGLAADLHTARRLNVAAQLYAAVLTGSSATLDAVPGKLLDQCLAHADRLIRANDQFRPAPPTTVPAPAPSLSLPAVRLLAYLCGRGPMEAWEYLPACHQSPGAKRDLLKAGMIHHTDHLGTIAPTPDGIALMRGEPCPTSSTDPSSTPSTPTAASSGTASSTPATTASAVPAG